MPKLSGPQLPRYRFAEFTVSPSRRLLLKSGEPVSLIPRYFDLLLLLLENRNEAIRRREILDAVWSDVVVSDGALSQAVRVLRRALGDDPRDPVYIRTVSRHGYRFVYDAVVEEADASSPPRRKTAETEGRPDRGKLIEAALTILTDPHRGENDRREAAEALHALGTPEALSRLDRRPGHEQARALLRDSRWEVSDAEPVPILGQPAALATARHLIVMRVRRVIRLARSRWMAAVGGGAVSGLAGGFLGGLALRFGPGSTATDSVLVALPLVGTVLGALAAVGVGAGLAGAEASFRSYRSAALVVFGALGGGAIGALAHGVGLLALEGLFGRDLSPVAGGFEGLVLGGAVGFGYAWATPTSEGGMATPRGWARTVAAALGGLTCGVSAILLAWTGSYLGAMSLDFMARSFPGSQVGLEPLARLLGEAEPGLMTRTVISGGEGVLFGFGVVLGLTRRPR